MKKPSEGRVVRTPEGFFRPKRGPDPTRRLPGKNISTSIVDTGLCLGEQLASPGASEARRSRAGIPCSAYIALDSGFDPRQPDSRAAPSRIVSTSVPGLHWTEEGAEAIR